MTPTTIRYAVFNNSTAGLMAQVVTYSDNTGQFSSVFQIYRANGSGKASLLGSSVWGNEDAVKLFDASLSRLEFIITECRNDSFITEVESLITSLNKEFC